MKRSKPDKQLIGFIGLGAIGKPIACNLIKAGHKLRYYSRSRSFKDDYLLSGSTSCNSPKEAAINVSVLILCVSDDEAVEDVIFNKYGAVNTLREGSTVIDFSTISPDKAISIGERLNKININYIDSPVTGGTEGARDGNLTLLVGGEPKIVKQVNPILEIVGNSINHFGPIGSGQKVKVINQILVAGTYTALAEAITLGQKLDLPIEKVVNVLNSGAGGSWALKNRSKSMVKDIYPLGFKLSLHHKDLEIALHIAQKNGIDLKFTSLVKSIEADLIDKGYGNEDVSVIKKSSSVLIE